MIRALIVAAVLWFWLPAHAHQPITTAITWNREVTRIFARSCVSCHRAGGSSFPLGTYAEARPWAKAIRDQVLERRMPPWPAARGIGDFKNDRSLPPRVIEMIVAWAEGGAPEGENSDSPQRSAAPAAQEDSVLDEKTPSLMVRDVAELQPGWRILAIEPLAREGQSVEVRLIQDGGEREPLLFIPRFDERYRYRYELRVPAVASKNARVEVLPHGRAKLFIAKGTGSPAGRQ